MSTLSPHQWSPRSRGAALLFREINVEHLVGGTGEWSNLQTILRMTFKQLIDASNDQQGEILRLNDFIKHLSQSYNSKLDRSIFEEFLERQWAGRVNSSNAQHEQDMAALREEVKELRQAQSRLEKKCGDGGQHSAAVSSALLTSTTETIATLSRRIELLQSELCRVVRAMDAKADGHEVDAALKLRASKKSLSAIQEESSEMQETIRRLRSRVDNAEASAETAGRKVIEQVESIKRALIEMEALKAKEGDQASSSSSTSIKNIETLLQQTSKRLNRTEKEVATWNAKLDERIREPLEESLKTFEQEIIKELDDRDESIRHQVQDIKDVTKEIQTKVQQDETVIREWLAKIEESLPNLRPDYIERVVHDAITNLEGNNRLMECSRPSLRQERSFRDIIRRLDDLDFDMAHAGMLFKVMQEVVCEALGALESDVLWQVGQWADLDQRARQEVTQRLDRIETQFSSKMPKALAEGPRMICAPEDIQTIQAIVREEVEKNQKETTTSRRRSLSHSPLRSSNGKKREGGASKSPVGHQRTKSTSSSRGGSIGDPLSLSKKGSPTKKVASTKATPGGEGGGQVIDGDEWEDLLARVDTLEVKVDRAAFVAAEDRSDLENIILKVEGEVSELKESVNHHIGRDGDTKGGGGAGGRNGGTVEMVASHLEDQILSCQEQVSSRLTDLKKRFDHPSGGEPHMLSVYSPGEAPTPSTSVRGAGQRFGLSSSDAIGVRNGSPSYHGRRLGEGGGESASAAKDLFMARIRSASAAASPSSLPPRQMTPTSASHRLREAQHHQLYPNVSNNPSYVSGRLNQSPSWLRRRREEEGAGGGGGIGVCLDGIGGEDVSCTQAPILSAGTPEQELESIRKEKEEIKNRLQGRLG